MAYRLQWWILLAIIVCVLLYSCFLVPYSLGELYYNKKSFVRASTIGGLLITLMAVTSNAFICFVLMCGSNVKRPLNFLVFTMALADIFLPLFHYPITLVATWFHYESLWHKVNYISFFRAIPYLKCLVSGAASFSILSLTTIVLLQFYQVFKKRDQIPTIFKVASTFTPLIISVITSIILYEYYNEEWAHAFDATVTLFIPLIIMFTLMIISCQITERSSTIDEVNSDQTQFVYASFLSYLILWLPWYSSHMLHKYCCRVDYHHFVKVNLFTENLMMLKCCTNIFILIIFDKRFRYTSQNIVKSCFPCFTTTESLQFEHKDFAIRYSASQNDITMDFDDEQTLID